MANYQFLTDTEKAMIAVELGVLQRVPVFDGDGNLVDFEYRQDDTETKKAAERAHYRASLTAQLKGEPEPPLVVTDTPSDVAVDVPVVKGPK